MRLLKSEVMMNRPQVSHPATGSLFRVMSGSAMQELRERADAILWVKSQMARHGVTFEALEAAGCFFKSNFAHEVQPAQMCYRDAQGHSWDGKGDMPDWLKRAVNAGQSVEHFRIADVRAEKGFPPAG